jgi:hypothetical protein
MAEKIFPKGELIARLAGIGMIITGVAMLAHLL